MSLSVHTFLDPVAGRRDPARSFATPVDGTASHRSLNRDNVGATLLIRCQRAALYRFWRDFDNLSRFMYGVRGTHRREPLYANWLIGAEEGDDVEWDTVIIEDIPGRLIRWRAADERKVLQAGCVQFRDAPGGLGTLVTAHIAYEASSIPMRKRFSRLFHRACNSRTLAELQRLKLLIEIGEVAIPGQPSVRIMRPLHCSRL